jgi:uncharacterized membrane-anchored protein YjiN (DUF445 family)
MRGRKLVDVWVHGVESVPTGKWENLIQKEVSHQIKEQVDKRLSVKLELLVRKNRREFDIDNVIEVVFNSLYQGPKFLIVNDYLVDNVEATKIPTENEEKTHIQIWEWIISRKLPSKKINNPSP